MWVWTGFEEPDRIGRGKMDVRGGGVCISSYALFDVGRDGSAYAAGRGSGLRGGEVVEEDGGIRRWMDGEILGAVMFLEGGVAE